MCCIWVKQPWPHVDVRIMQETGRAIAYSTGCWRIKKAVQWLYSMRKFWTSRQGAFVPWCARFLACGQEDEMCICCINLSVLEVVQTTCSPSAATHPSVHQECVHYLLSLQVPRCPRETEESAGESVASHRRRHLFVVAGYCRCPVRELRLWHDDTGERCGHYG